jgi:predicted Zn finger-like uncharacterized protein
MIINCPECNARYNLTPAQIGAEGRKVRCVKCSHEWFQKPLGIEFEPDEEQPPLPPANDDDIPSPIVRREVKKPNTTIIATVAAAVLLIVAAGGLFFFKDTLLFSSTIIAEDDLQQSDDMATMSKSDTGLVIGNVTRTVVEDGDLSILVFTGTITNTNVTDAEVSPIRVAIFNEKGIELDSFPALPKKTILPPGETTEWVCRFFNPPLDKISEFKANFATKG